MNFKNPLLDHIFFCSTKHNPTQESIVITYGGSDLSLQPACTSCNDISERPTDLDICGTRIFF